MTPQERQHQISEREKMASPLPWESMVLSGVLTSNGWLDGDAPETDQVFTVHARSDVPYLLARIAQLEGVLGEIMADPTDRVGTRGFCAYYLALMPEGYDE